MTFRLAVLNPGGNDPEQQFPDFAGAPDDRVHPPVNYHGYAACTGGSFHRSAASISSSQNNVLLLVRHDVMASLTALRTLKRGGKTVAISFKESGLHQVAAALADAKNLVRFQELCALANGAISSTPELAPIYRAARAKRAEFIPTPYPVDDARWDFSARPESRRGVFIGTREFDVPSRNHAAALLLARTLGEPVTVVNVDGRAGRKLLAAVQTPAFTIHEGRLPYPRYLQLIARHQLVFQLDRSAVPGQIAGDALLAGIPCVGGDGATERLVFENENGHGREPSELAEIAADLLADPAARAQAATRAQAAARANLSFAAVASRLEKFYAEIPRD